MKRIIWKKPDGSVARECVAPDVDFDEFLPLAQQRENDKGVDGMEFAGVCDEADDLPPHHEHYFDALEWDGTGKRPKPNLNKCKAIAHEKRRAKREAEFAPLDAVIAKQIPGASATEAEAKRRAIRDKYAAVQNAIDTATGIDGIEAALQ